MKQLRMLVNIAMTGVLLCLMAYSLIGEKTHEILGMMMLALFTLHHILNRRWFGALARGRYRPFRVLQTALVFALILSVLGSAVSGVVLSRYVFAFLPPRGGAALARQVHLVCACLNLILMSLHLGLHWNSMLAALGGKADSPAWRVRVLRVLAAALAGYGLYAFVRRQIGEYLLLQSQFVFYDPSESLIRFFLDYGAIMALFILAGHYLAKAVKRAGKGSGSR